MLWRRISSLLLLFGLCLSGIPVRAQGVVIPEILIPEAKVSAPLSTARTREEVISLTQHYFWRNDFKQLEATAAAWRQSKERFSDTSWKVTAFYDALSLVSTSSSSRQQWLEQAKKWARQSPTSITAQIVLATVYYRLAAIAYFDDFDEKEAEELLGQARTVLREAKKLNEKCPHWWATTLNVGRLQGWDRVTFDAVFKEAVAFEAEYDPFYLYKSRYLAQLSETETAKFCQEAADLRGGERGAMLYANLIRFLSTYEHETIHAPDFSFDRLDQGLQAIDRFNPHNLDFKVMWTNLCGCMYQNAPARKARIRVLVGELEKLQPSLAARWRWDVKKASDWAFDKQDPSEH